MQKCVIFLIQEVGKGNRIVLNMSHSVEENPSVTAKGRPGKIETAVQRGAVRKSGSVTGCQSMGPYPYALELNDML